MQYTLRKVPRSVDARLRRRARAERRSLNSVALEALARGAGVDTSPKRDLADVAGTWVEDPEFDRAIVLQHGFSLCTRDRHFDHLPQILRAPES